MEFLDFLGKLAQEGETNLIVRQKPMLKDGQLQYHKDGAIKCTWPAMLPTKWKPKQALYGNTAIFIIDRMREKVSASAANADYVGVMILDDVGTKSKAPTIKPTWVMETSPGNYQWGYALDPQPTTMEFSAAIIAIAAAGYTDKGAINPVRNFRLPGSVNLKPQHNGFESVLVEFNPDVSIDIAEFCKVHGVVPAAANTAKHKVVDLFDDGKDDVMLWLSENGYLLERVNPSGWAGVTCPNHAEHTDGNPMGRYAPATRSYCCLHAHCCDWNSERFLTWVGDQGGPSHNSGLRSELLVGTLAPALAKIEELREGMDFSKETDASERVKQVEMQELGRIDKAKLHESYCYVEDNNAYFALSLQYELSRVAFDATYAHLPCNSIHGKNPKIKPSVWFDENRFAKGSKVLAGLTYAPGETILCARDGLVYGNRWRDARPVGVAGSVAPWLAHLNKLIPLEFEREHLLNVMAHKVQHPNVKINHAVLLGGTPGVGKDTLLAPFFYAVSGPHEKNKALVDTKVLESQFGYGMESEIMIVNELRPDQFKDRRALENTLKPIIAAPPEFLTVNRKGLHPYQAVNRVLVVAMSNYRDAIALPSDDRRWFCLWAEGEIMPKEESDKLWKWYKSSGFSAITHWLQQRDVSAFNPAATPPMTEAKHIMLEQSRSGTEEYLISCLENRIGDFASGVIAAPFHRLCDRLQGSAPQGAKVTAGVLMHALTEAGWRDLGRVHTSEFKTTKRMFCAPGMLDTHSKSTLRRIAEGVETGVGLKAVK